MTLLDVSEYASRHSQTTPYTGDLFGVPIWLIAAVGIAIVLLGLVAYTAAALGGITDRRDGR